MSDRKETYIYESPDNGETIYRRLFGSNVQDRELYKISEKKKTFYQDLQRNKLWGEIHRAAERDPAIKEMLDQIVVYHTLKKDIP